MPNELISILNQAEGLYRNLGQSAETHSIGQVRATSRNIDGLLARAQGVAVGYGFKKCGQG